MLSSKSYISTLWHLTCRSRPHRRDLYIVKIKRFNLIEDAKGKPHSQLWECLKSLPSCIEMNRIIASVVNIAETKLEMQGWLRQVERYKRFQQDHCNKMQINYPLLKEEQTISDSQYTGQTNILGIKMARHTLFKVELLCIINGNIYLQIHSFRRNLQQPVD
jgi:hypothetical protein